MGWALVAVAARVAWLFLERSNELFALSFRNGEGRLVRGVAPARLRMDFVDALKSMKVQRATVKVVKSERGARVVASGLDDFQAQRLRNILQLFPAAQLRSGTAPAQNKLLRLFGFSALMWLLGARDE